jgi:hypothetical protein
MAPVLQCPDCGTKHPIDVASSSSSVFRCNGCGRTLKVPVEYQRAAPVATARSADGDRDPNATAAMAAVAPAKSASTNGHTLSRRNVRAQAGVVPFWMRLLVWIVAVPLGFLIVFGFARVAGLLTQTQLEDVFLDTGWHRFWPVARMLPFVALVTAAIVHFSVLFMSRWRMQHANRPLQPRPAPVTAKPAPASEPDAPTRSA